jgi:hypothetical protein
LSVSFFPPYKEYVSLEDLAKKFPDYAYQLYFADPANTKKIENQVTPFSTPHFPETERFQTKQIEMFYRSLFAVPGSTTGRIDDLVQVLDAEVRIDPSVIKTILSDEVGPV